MRPKLTLWNAPVHLIMDVIQGWKTMDIKRWGTRDTLTVLVSAVLGWSFIHFVLLVCQIYSLAIK